MQMMKKIFALLLCVMLMPVYALAEEADVPKQQPAAAPDSPMDAACAAMAVMGVCGELAEEKRLRMESGNASFRSYLIDEVFMLSENKLKERLRYEIYKG